jgi:hypothetical protein
MKRKNKYRIFYAGYVLEGEATTPQNAVRKAIRALIRQQKIPSAPESKYGWWVGVTCQLLPTITSSPK